MGLKDGHQDEDLPSAFREDFSPSFDANMFSCKPL